MFKANFDFLVNFVIKMSVFNLLQLPGKKSVLWCSEFKSIWCRIFSEAILKFSSVFDLMTFFLKVSIKKKYWENINVNFTQYSAPSLKNVLLLSWYVFIYFQIISSPTHMNKFFTKDKPKVVKSCRLSKGEQSSYLGYYWGILKSRPLTAICL